MLEAYINLLKAFKEKQYDFSEHEILECRQADFVNPLNEHWSVHMDFLDEFYKHTQQKRNLIIGINPGKDGANKTSIAFTDPYNAREYLNLNLENVQNRENSSSRLYPLFLKEFDNDMKAFFNIFHLTNLYPFGATIPGVRGIKNMKFEHLKKIPHFKEVVDTHLKGLVSIFKPDIIIAVGGNVYSEVRRHLKENNNGDVIVIQAIHPAYASKFNDTEKKRWRKILRLANNLG